MYGLCFMYTIFGQLLFSTNKGKTSIRVLLILIECTSKCLFDHIIVKPSYRIYIIIIYDSSFAIKQNTQ